MFLTELFATMRARRRSTHRYNEEGTKMTRRLLELRDATKLEQVETLSAIPVSGSLPQSRRPLERKER